MQYPSDWTKESHSPPRTDFATFDSLQTNSKDHSIAEVRLGTFDKASSLSHDLKTEINGYLKDWSGQAVDSNTSSTLAGQSAFKLLGTYTTSYGIDQKVVETGTIVGSKVYYIKALIDADQYSNYIPIVEQMINSYTLSAPTL
ncbi:MAG: hypothetical protein WA667_06130 [Candidatus Nitrosopolaris sp.]